MTSQVSLYDLDEAMLPQFPMQRTCPVDPPPEYEGLREDKPVAPVRLWDGRRAWLISRYDDVRSVLADRRVSNNILHPGFPILYEARAAVFARYESVPYFHFMDSPEHTQYRRMATREFGVARVNEMAPFVQEVIDDLIDTMLASADRSADFVSSFGLALPTRVICKILGIPETDAEKIGTFLHGLGSFNQDPDEAVAATVGLTEYVDEMITSKEQAPGEDLVTRVIEDHFRTGELTRHQLVQLIRFLLVVGHETTASMLSLGMLTLLEDDSARSELQGDPGLVDSAVEELLRYLSIVHLTTCRVASEDFEVAGQTIKAGDGIVALLSSANRDEARFEGADGLNLHREGRNHVAFGFGVHQCLGQPLARLELRLAFAALLSRMPSMQLATPADSLDYKDYINGVQALPIKW
ncbi:cytochrome P450 [Ilumatobacter coccineus]|uniref:Cytochrome P450 n=1 Tax=Ilumatobacter coccineus (strain NBRC 103263 / KCTC 29153 / YM16-304) TaxID=1313172 RepID=A0A6C7E5H1_ILUCY|nr:cytochrome P450 [Ilumatobacter coccineus]BAN02077.1 cytochrome P450 [Ilumatobacter coccineus YM16-304]